MQKSVREIFLSFKGPADSIPVLLNVEVHDSDGSLEIHCGGMVISNRNRFEKELIEAKKLAEETLAENAELIEVKDTLLQHQKELESQFRILKSLKEQQNDIFKIIAHDLQEPLRKAVFTSNFLLADRDKVEKEVALKLDKIISYSSQMREMLLTLQRYEELENRNLTFEPIQLSAVIQEAVIKLNIKAEDKIKVSYPSDSPVFYADPRLLVHFFIELIRNSLNNRDPKKDNLTIEISILEMRKNVFIESSEKYQYEKFVKITYVDNGSGFLADSSQIFKILQKSAQFNKISIGMAFCKRIVEKHSGSIVAKSVKGVGVGYTIFLPMKQS